MLVHPIKADAQLDMFVNRRHPRTMKIGVAALESVPSSIAKHFNDNLRCLHDLVGGFGSGQFWHGGNRKCCPSSFKECASVHNQILKDKA